MCLSIGTPKIVNFPFGTNGKLSILGVPIFKHIRVLGQIVPSKQKHYKNVLGMSAMSY